MCMKTLRSRTSNIACAIPTVSAIGLVLGLGKLKILVLAFFSAMPFSAFCVGLTYDKFA